MAQIDYFGDIASLSASIKSRDVSAVEVATDLLARIGDLEPRLRAFVTLTSDLALAQARAADADLTRGHWRGPLHGVPIAVKDLLWTKDLPTTAGMPIHAGFKPTTNATVIDRLEAAGAVLLGKLALTEGAVGDHHPDIAPPLNPWDAAAWTGASSSGSGVAVAAGLCFAALGTDTGGSIRFPSAANGVTGLKPTWGRVSRHGLLPLSEAMDCIGPLARSVADAALIFSAIAGADAQDPTAVLDPVPLVSREGIGDLRVGFDPATLAAVDAPTAAAITAAADTFVAQGARLVQQPLPDLDQPVRAWRVLCSAGAARIHRESFAQHAASFGPSLRAVIEHGHALTAMDVDQALADRERLRGEMRLWFENADVLLLPVQATAGPSLADMRAGTTVPDWRERLLRYVSPFALTGQPVLVLPCGATASGLPIGLQLVGRPFQEGVLLRAGHAFQAATGWHRRHPLLSSRA
jgi:amidase